MVTARTERDHRIPGVSNDAREHLVGQAVERRGHAAVNVRAERRGRPEDEDVRDLRPSRRRRVRAFVVVVANTARAGWTGSYSPADVTPTVGRASGDQMSSCAACTASDSEAATAASEYSSKLG